MRCALQFVKNKEEEEEKPRKAVINKRILIQRSARFASFAPRQREGGEVAADADAHGYGLGHAESAHVEDLPRLRF